MYGNRLENEKLSSQGRQGGVISSPGSLVPMLLDAERGEDLHVGHTYGGTLFPFTKRVLRRFFFFLFSLKNNIFRGEG